MTAKTKTQKPQPKPDPGLVIFVVEEGAVGMWFAAGREGYRTGWFWDDAGICVPGATSNEEALATVARFHREYGGLDEKADKDELARLDAEMRDQTDGVLVDLQDLANDF